MDRNLKTEYLQNFALIKIQLNEKLSLIHSQNRSVYSNKSNWFEEYRVLNKERTKLNEQRLNYLYLFVHKIEIERIYLIRWCVRTHADVCVCVMCIWIKWEDFGDHKCACADFGGCESRTTHTLIYIWERCVCVWQKQTTHSLSIYKMQMHLKWTWRSIEFSSTCFFVVVQIQLFCFSLLHWFCFLSLKTICENVLSVWFLQWRNFNLDVHWFIYLNGSLNIVFWRTERCVYKTKFDWSMRLPFIVYRLAGYLYGWSKVKELSFI